MQYSKNAIILAAGMGSRLGMDKPKCLVEVHDKKIIDYQLDLLKDFEDIRIVVGFKEEDVIEHVSKVRKDITFVRNSQYASTSNIISGALATRHLSEPFIFLDGDIIIRKDDFSKFVKECQNSKETIVGVTKAKTEEAVFAKIEDSRIIKFSTSEKYEYEWCGIAYFYDLKINNTHQGYIYKIFEENLPIRSFELEVYEIDTPYDYSLATKRIKDNNF